MYLSRRRISETRFRRRLVRRGGLRLINSVDLHEITCTKRQKWKDVDGDFVLFSCKTSIWHQCTLSRESEGCGKAVAIKEKFFDVEIDDLV